MVAADGVLMGSWEVLMGLDRVMGAANGCR